MPDAGCRMPDAGCRMPDAGRMLFFRGDIFLVCSVSWWEIPRPKEVRSANDEPVIGKRLSGE